MIARLSSWYDDLLALCGMLAGGMIALIAVSVSLDVALRNAGLGTLPWLIEVVEYALYVSTFIAAPWVLRLGAHVRVDLLLSGLGPGAARRVEIAVDLLGLAIAATLFYYSLLATIDAYRIGSLIIKELVIPEWWLFAVMPATIWLLALEFLRRAVRARRREPAGEAAPPTDGL